MRKWFYDRRQRQIDNLGNVIAKLSDTLKTAEPGSFEQEFIETARVNAFQRRNKLIAKQHKESPHVRA